MACFRSTFRRYVGGNERAHRRASPRLVALGMASDERSADFVGGAAVQLDKDALLARALYRSVCSVQPSRGEKWAS